MKWLTVSTVEWECDIDVDVRGGFELSFAWIFESDFCAAAINRAVNRCTLYCFGLMMHASLSYPTIRPVFIPSLSGEDRERKECSPLARHSAGIFDSG